MKLRPLKYHLPNWSIITVGIVSVVLIYFMVWRIDAPGYRSVIGGDGKDYYSYLISVFIDRDLRHQDTSPWYITQTSTGTINVHTIGVSLMLLPFFGAACLWAYASGAPMTGMSEPFEKMISLGALVYLLIGLFFLYRLLLSYRISSRTAGFVVLAVFFGTNLINYALNEPAMSHVYSFSLIAAFLYYSRSVFHNYTHRYLLATSITLALIILVRPADVLIVFALPLLSENFGEFRQALKRILSKDHWWFILSVISFLCILSLQSITWYLQDGRFLQWTYQDNGFYFLHPQFWKMLFGFNGGLFIYTPLALLFLCGIFSWKKINRFQAFAAAGFFLFLFYFLSSYCGYTYNDGLGIRPVSNYYSLFAIPGAMMFDGISGMLWKSFICSLAVVMVAINLLYCYQYKTGIMQASGMNFEKWSYILFHTGKSYRNLLGGCNDLEPYSPTPVTPFCSYSDNDSIRDQEPSRNIFSLGKLGVNSNKLFLQIKLKLKDIFSGSSGDAFLQIQSASAQDSVSILQVFRLNEVPTEECCAWKNENYNIVLPGHFDNNDRFEIAVENPDKKPFLLKDLNINIYNYNYLQK